MMNAADEMFFLDDDRNLGNIVTATKYEKFDAERFGLQMVRKARSFPRLKSTIKKFLGMFMFYELDDDEFLELCKKYVIKVTGIHTEKQVADFMAQEQARRDPIDGLQWRCYLVEDYTETESMFIYKVHHSLADGIATVLMFFSLCDDEHADYKDFPQLMIRFPPLKQLLINAALPFVLGYTLFKSLFFLHHEKNGFKQKSRQGTLNA